MLRLTRLLLDPTAVDGGGSDAPPPSPPAVEMRSISAADYDAMVAQVAELGTIRQTQATELAAKEHARLVALAEKGQAQDAIRQSNEAWQKRLDAETERYNTLDAQILGAAKTAAFQAAFSGRSFAGESPEERQLSQADLVRLIEADYEAVREPDGRVVVRETKTGRAVADSLKERLDGKRYARFLASNGGGTPPPPAGPFGGGGGTPIADGNLAKIVADWQSRQTAAIGLHPVR